MPKSRVRKKVNSASPFALKRAEEGHRYRQSINWSKSLVMRAAKYLVSMAVIVLGVVALGPKLAFGTYAALLVLALAGAFALALKAKHHNRRFRQFNSLLPVGARIPEPDRLRRRY